MTAAARTDTEVQVWLRTVDSLRPYVCMVFGFMSQAEREINKIVGAGVAQ